MGEIKIGATKSNARQQIMDTAARLFGEQGFRAIGVDTIIEQSGVAKMTLYRHFPSKDDLIVAYLEWANQKFWEWLEGSIADKAGDPRAQLIGIFEAVAVLTTKPFCHGCSFQNTAVEFPSPDYPGHKVALAHKEQVHERLRGLAEQAGLAEPARLADRLMLLMDGAFMAVRMFGHAGPAREVAHAARILIENNGNL
jgi:AcrR family transcriptional regulator